MTLDQPCLVVFHAHPDDEVIFTGGAIIRAKRANWRVVVVFATSGEQGRKPEWVVGDLADHRRAEAEAAARLLGVDDIAFLGYRDSGVEQPTFGPPRSGTSAGLPLLARTSVLEAAERLRRVLREQRATALTSYDESGIYGHPDHIQVHAIAAAAVLDTTCDLIEATVDRRHLRAIRRDLVTRGLVPEIWPAELVDRIGTEDNSRLITLELGTDLDRKLEAVAAHASQIVEAQEFMGLPPGAFPRFMTKETFRPARVLDRRLCDLLAAG